MFASYNTGQRSPPSTLTFSIFSLFLSGEFCNVLLTCWTTISSSVRVCDWAVPVSYDLFCQQCVWGTWVTVLMTCHTIFIAVTRLFMGPPDPSEPAVGSAISLFLYSPLLPSTLQLALYPPLFLSNPPGFSPLFTLFSLFFYCPLFPSVLAIFLTLSTDHLHLRHHRLPTTPLPSSLPGGVTLKWPISPQTELNIEGGWALVDFVKLLINGRADGQGLLKPPSFRLALRHVRWDWDVCHYCMRSLNVAHVP